MENNVGLIPIDPAYLAGLVRIALRNDRLVVNDWQVQPLYAGLEFSSRLFRLQGHAVDAELTLPWSLILKVIQPDIEFNDPQGFRFWKREAMAYQSSSLNALPGGIATPRCYDICAQPDGALWLFLEEVKDESDWSCSLDHYAWIARCLGEFNGAYLVGRPLPDAAWVTHGWLRKYLEHASPAVEFIRQHPDHPLVQALFPGVNLAITLAVWDVHPRLLKMLDELPQTFCHQDAFERNLFLRAGQVLAIDWSYAGVAPAGAELAPLVSAGLGLGKFPPSQARELDKACFSGYVEGLRRAGWHPDIKQVRLGYTLTTCLRYVLGGTVGEIIPALLDQEKRSYISLSLESSAKDVGKSDPHVIAYYQGLLVEILRQLGLGFTLQLLGRVMSYSIRLRQKARTSTRSA